MSPRKYNPLDYESLSESLARELMASELVPLGGISEFYGSGVYALFYCGKFPAYEQMSGINRKNPGSLPIYIGKAEPKTLKGVSLDPSMVDKPQAGTALYKRVANDHRKSIENAVNLEVSEFQCKLLVLSPIWVTLAESALIARYVPVWNSTVQGFGSHDPGKGRASGKPSYWDVIHPGRKRTSSGAPTDSYETICNEAKEAIRERIRILGL